MKYSNSTPRIFCIAVFNALYFFLKIYLVILRNKILPVSWGGVRDGNAGLAGLLLPSLV